jgi:hypothetical protein
MIDFDTSRLPSKPSEWLGLLEAVRDADPADESDWIEWKSSVDWSSKEHLGAVVARAILGMANRPEPPSALGGNGLVILGLEAGQVLGVAPIDPADLESKLRPYLGEEGPAFDPHWLTVDGQQVLAIEVPNPPPGSPMYSLRKEVGKSVNGKEVARYLNGTIFVRGPGKTEQATAAQMDSLVARARRGVDEAIEIDILPDEGDPVPHALIDDEAIEAFINWERTRLMASSVKGTQRSSPLVIRYDGDNRTVVDFTREVDNYIAEVRAVIRERLQEFGGTVIRPIVVRASNRGATNYPGLRVTLFIDGPVVGTDVDYEPEEGLSARLPRPPRVYGTSAILDIVGINYTPHLLPAGAPTRREIENGDDLIIRLAEIELRSHEKGTVIESELVLLVPPEHEGPVVVAWEATTANVRGIARGSFTVPVSDASIDLLRASLRIDADKQRD